MICPCCKKEMTPQEEITYKNKCEDCWARHPDAGGDIVPYSSAVNYSPGTVGNIGEVTNQDIGHTEPE